MDRGNSSGRVGSGWNGGQIPSSVIPGHGQIIFFMHFFVYLRDLRTFVVRIYSFSS